MGLVFAFTATTSAQDYVRFEGPDLLSYEELVELSKDQEIKGNLADKVQLLRTMPFVSNEAYYRGAKPSSPSIPGLGKSMRVAFWNIERGVHLDEIKLLFTDPDELITEAEANAEEGSEPLSIDREQLLNDIGVIRSADVIVVNEVDWGMPRSDYRKVIHELGETLNMNWAWGAEFIEIDPAVLGLEDYEEIEDEEIRAELQEASRAVDKNRLRALHGTAILSKYPISEAVLRPFELVPYDWYGEETALRPGEQGIRAGARFIGEDMNREMRRGARTALLVQLAVPDLDEGYLTVVSPHLENRTKPENRLKQMNEVLGWIHHIKNPVIIAGDLNTTTGDSQAFRLERQVYKKLSSADYWGNKGIKAATGVGLVYDVFKAGFSFTKAQSDPTTMHIPFFSPNKEAALFDRLADFRFQDGKAFDFRGDSERAIGGRAGTLANSNQRGLKGFICTYDFVITVGVVGKYKLDWIFVKSYLEYPRDRNGPYRFAPHFARTLESINQSLGALSDHHPMTVDLPFSEPEL